MTANQTILAACARLSGGHGIEAVLPEEEIILESWRINPALFGLPGHRDEHPDSKRVACELAKGKPLDAAGLIRRVAPRMYRLTLAGAEFGEVALRTIMAQNNEAK